MRCSFKLSILQSDKRKKNTLYLKPCSLSTNEDNCDRKRRFNQLIFTNLATPSGFSWNKLEPHNSNSPCIFWTDLVLTSIFFKMMLIIIVLTTNTKLLKYSSSWLRKQQLNTKLKDFFWDCCKPYDLLYIVLTLFEIWYQQR